jgi:hypothetical protein
MALLILAMLSKPSAALLPLAFMAADRKGRPLVWLAPLAVNLGLSALAWSFETDLGALAGGGEETGLLGRVLAGAWRHAMVLVQPFDLATKYIDPPGGPETATLVGGGIAIAAVASLLVLALVRRHPSWLGLAVALLAYLPVSGAAPLSRQYADSYVYVPMVGICLAAAGAIAPLAGKVGGLPRLVASLAAAVLVVSFCLAARGRSSVFEDGVSLWTAEYARYPDSPQVCRNLGNAWMYGRHNEPARAANVYEHCIATLGNRAFFVKNLGIARFAAGDLPGAAQALEEAGKTRPDDPVVERYLRAIRGGDGEK